MGPKSAFRLPLFFKLPSLAAMLIAVVLAPLSARPVQADWVELGRTTVQGRGGTDRINVNSNAQFRAIQFTVQRSAVRIRDVVVRFTNGRRYTPGIRELYLQGNRGRRIDLPGNSQRIQSVTFRFGNIPSGRRATIILSGDRNRGGIGGGGGGDRGWVELGETRIVAGRDRGRIDVRRRGEFNAIRFAARGSSVRLREVVVRFEHGRSFSPTAGAFLLGGQRTRVINLPGVPRSIQSVMFRYGNLPRGSSARVILWGRRALR